MIVKAWMTGTAVTWHDDSGDNYTEEHGWIDPSWSHHELCESRNDVRPVAEWDSDDPDDTEDHPTLNDFIRATVAEFLGSAEDNGDGTFYSQDDSAFNCRECWQDVRTWSYALHFTHKRHDSRRGWVEDSVILTEEGN